MPRLITKILNKSSTKDRYLVESSERLILILIANCSVAYSLEVNLTGADSEADIYGIIIGKKNDQIILHTIQNHQAPRTRSNLLVKSVLSDKSSLNFEGFISVDPIAQRTDAYQRNENLMLSSEAKTESKPALEILANDVRCTHSATISKINCEELFYLESRGISTVAASNMVIEGFFDPILSHIKSAILKKRILNEINTLVY